MAKLAEKEKAIKLRKEGLSYYEILKEIPVAKSTLSLWLRSIGLSKRQKQRLTKKKLSAMRRGWKTSRRKRLEITKAIKFRAREEIGKISKRDLWVIGTALYWAEGTKEKEYRGGEKVVFSNSEPGMISLFIKWLKDICLVSPFELTYELYIHETANWKEAKRYWGKIIPTPNDGIRVYFKRHKVKKRRTTGENYHGLIRIKVRKSINLNRRISGWVEGIRKNCGVV